MVGGTEQEVIEAESNCERLRKQFKRGQTEIKRRRREIEHQRRLIAELKAAPEPDQARIKAEQKVLAQMEESLKADQEAQDELGQFILENCSPDP
jgi:predicted  nucleic acid-binding Zn-ribbon protein